MKRLVLDTSNKYLYIAVMEDEQIIKECIKEGNNNHSETLIKVLEETLQEVKLNINDIDEVYVGRGPGSYTGIRVACTFAKVFTFIRQKKLFSFSSLDLLLTANLQKGIIVCQIDARRGFSFAKVF